MAIRIVRVRRRRTVMRIVRPIVKRRIVRRRK